MMKLHKTVFKNYALVALLVALGIQGQAQTEPTRPVTIDSFDVVRDYKPLLADAVKIRRSPDMTNKRSYMPKLSYNNIADKKLDINTGLKELKIEETPFAAVREQHSNYVRAGVGNLGTFLGEAYFSYDEYEDMRVGGFVKHLNQKGSLEGQRFSKQEVGIFGRRVFPQFTIDGLIGYNRNGTNFYGVPFASDNNTPLNTNIAKQSFNDIYFSGELTSNNSADNEDALSYSAKIDAYSFGDDYDAKETSFGLSAYLNKRVRTFNIGANLSLDLNKVDGTNRVASDGVTKNSLAILNPYISFKGENYAITLGANMVPEFGDSTSFNIFPSAEIDFGLAPGYLHIFGGIDGGVKKASYRDFARANPYLGPGMHIQNMVERLHVYGGIKGNAGATFGYKAKAIYRKIEGLPLFVNNFDKPYLFDIVYDGNGDKAVKHIGVEGEINIRLSELVNLGGRLNVDQYTAAQETEVWHTPEIRLAANARFNISEKLYIDAEALFHGSSKAKVYDYNPTTLKPEGAFMSKEVPSFFDLSAGAEYKATKQLGVFVRANNIFNKEYQTYMYYPKLGFNLLGGLNFSF